MFITAVWLFAFSRYFLIFSFLFVLKVNSFEFWVSFLSLPFWLSNCQINSCDIQGKFPNICFLEQLSGTLEVATLE